MKSGLEPGQGKVIGLVLVIALFVGLITAFITRNSGLDYVQDAHVCLACGKPAHWHPPDSRVPDSAVGHGKTKEAAKDDAISKLSSMKLEAELANARNENSYYCDEHKSKGAAYGFRGMFAFVGVLFIGLLLLPRLTKKAAS